MKVIDVCNLSKKYKDKTIFENLSFDIEEGEMVAIIGDSGKGKTTLLNCLGGLDKIDGGEITVLGKSLTAKNRKWFFREVYGFLFQNFALVDNETVLQNLAIVSTDKSLIRDYLDKFGLGQDCLKKPVYQLSGGEQQRVALIRMLLKSPRIVLADEPTASLDLDNSIFVMETLRELKKSGVTVVVVTHDKQLLPYFDRVLDLNVLTRLFCENED